MRITKLTFMLLALVGLTSFVSYLSGETSKAAMTGGPR